MQKKPTTPTSLKNLLNLCLAPDSNKSFSEQDFCFLHGYLSGLQTARGNLTISQQDFGKYFPSTNTLEGFKSLSTNQIDPVASQKQAMKTGNPYMEK